MSSVPGSFGIAVDVTNPGQVLACCGLLELAHRVWPGIEGWFEGSRFMAAGHGMPGVTALRDLISKLARCPISGLTAGERKERDELERLARELKKIGRQLSADQERRRKELGEQARTGTIHIGPPFDLLLHWWQSADEEATPKTWAGRQELHKIARAAQEALSNFANGGDLARLLDYGCVLRKPREYQQTKRDAAEAVEPFYFDARRFVHPLDVGFSLDVQDAETIAYPAVELLCLIGLQRFRPVPLSDERWSFDYWTWSRPMSAPVAAAVFSGVVPVPGRGRYRFRLLFRDDQKRYKAFSPAIPMGSDA